MIRTARNPGRCRRWRRCEPLAARPGPTDTLKYWSGDEGVFLRGLAPYINGIVTDPNIKQELLRNSQKLITAAITTPNGLPDTQNVMHESPNPPD